MISFFIITTYISVPSIFLLFYLLCSKLFRIFIHVILFICIIFLNIVF